MRLLSGLLVRLRLLSQPLHDCRDDARRNTTLSSKGYKDPCLRSGSSASPASCVFEQQRWILSIVLVVADLRETAARKK